MSIYRRMVRGKRSKFYTAEFTFGRHRYRQGGFPDRDAAKHWIATESIRLRRGRTGYVKPMNSAAVNPLITAFVAELRARGCDEMYCYTAEKRLNKLAEECAWRTLGHVTAASLQAWTTSGSEWKKHKIGGRTINQYLAIAVEWGAWLAKPSIGKLPSNPLDGVERVRANHNDLYRRAGTLDELERLLATCPPDRRLCYLFRIYHPLRRKTLRQMTWAMLKLDATPPYISLPAALNKSRRDERHALRYDVAQELRKSKKRAKVSDLVFPTVPTVDDLKVDLASAEIKFADSAGNARLDFHALRKTLVRLAKRSGVSLDDASLLLGHRDINTTRKHYDEDAVRPELSEAVEKLPALGQMRRAQ